MAPRIDKANAAYFVRFIALWSQNGSFQTQQISLCSVSHLRPWIMGNESAMSQMQQQRWDFCEGLTAWHLTTKCAVVKFIKPWMSSHFSQSRDLSYIHVVSAICPACPTKIGKARRAGCTQEKAAQRLSKDKVEWLHLRPCLVPSWCGISRIIRDCWIPRGMSNPHRVVVPSTLMCREAGKKMNETALQCF